MKEYTIHYSTPGHEGYITRQIDGKVNTDEITKIAKDYLKQRGIIAPPEQTEFIIIYKH